jgi:6,7-dimethyl-8-ribityllumazine synthase
MSEMDDSQDWPLRDFSARLRPPSSHEDRAETEREPDPPAPTQVHELAVEPFDEPEPPPTASSEIEVLYDEDEPVEVAADEPTPTGSGPVETTGAPEPVEEQAEEPAPEPETQHAEGDLRIPDGYSVLEGAPNGQRRTVAVVVSRFNGEITNRLLESAMGALEEAGVPRDAVLVMPVPGAFELPIAAMALAKTRRYSCVVALGCVIRGETPHFDFVAGEAASGLQLAGIETGVPVSLGLLTCDTSEQAEARVERGAWAARTALEMADAFAQLRNAVARG